MKCPARWLLSAVLGTTLLYGVGCASIVHSGNRPVAIDSNPEGALVSVTNRKGVAVASDRTPCTVRLDPRGGFFSGERYTVTFTLDGYVTSEAPIHPELSPWYLGNLVFGGLIGLIIVDPLTGSMWNLRPLHMEQALEKTLPPLASPASSGQNAVPSSEPVPSAASPPPAAATTTEGANILAQPPVVDTNSPAQPPPISP